MNLTPSQHALYEKACARMKRQAPDWNAELPSDPAFSVLELAVFLSNLQEETFQQVQDRHELAYLKLLGTAPRTRSPAHFWAEGAERSGLFLGQRFWIDGVPFEVAHTGENWGAIQAAALQTKAGVAAWDGIAPMTVWENGATLQLAFSRPLPEGRTVRIWCELLPETGRIPTDGKPPFPIALCGVLPDGKPFPIQDGTCGLLRSGFLSFQLPESAKEMSVRLTGELEGQPSLSKLVLEPVLLVQRNTRSTMVELTPPFQLPKGWPGSRTIRFFLPKEGGGWREDSELSVGTDYTVSGWAGNTPLKRIRVCVMETDFICEFPIRQIAEEEIVLTEEGILPGTLRIMVRENGVWWDCPIKKSFEKGTVPRGCSWNAEKKALCFGDGRDLPIPKADRVFVAACACTQGIPGNGAGGTLKQEGVELVSLCPAAGGGNEETPHQAFQRVAGQQENVRAVSLADYETISRRTPGLALEKVQALRGKGQAGVMVLAKPRTKAERPELTAWQTQRLQMWLERFRMLAVPVTVRGPTYVPVEVSAFVHLSGPVDRSTLETAVFRLTDGVTGPLDFGAELSYAAIFAALGAVPNVQTVESLQLHVPVATGLIQNREGGVRLEPDMLPYLHKFQLDTIS